MTRRERLIGAIRQRASEDTGFTLVITSMALVVLLGMAALSVDLGWLYLETTRARKAAESAALAGVVHMPLPTNVAFSGSEAETVALDMASTIGYTNSGGTTVTPSEIAGRPNELRVDIATSTNTFFMRLFGIDQVDFTRDATAQQLPPLKLGSDEPYLGTDPGVNERFFWVAINGECRRKQDGDPYAPRGQGSRCRGGSNTQFRDPAYYYGIEVTDANIGDSLTVSIFDGPTNEGGLPGDRGTDDTPRNAVASLGQAAGSSHCSESSPRATSSGGRIRLPLGGSARCIASSRSPWSSCCSEFPAVAPMTTTRRLSN